ncbi:MAG: ABC transporter permease [Deltaproteobacteria bacterium]|nr:ABC transporter permease [Deltaproteobacteria bacterium]
MHGLLSGRSVPLLGAAILGVLLLVAIFAPWLAPYPPGQMDLLHALEGPSAEHWLGTDEDGADLLTAILHGARLAVLVGFSTVLVCLAVGLLVGSVAGWYGGLVDELLMRLVDLVMAFPGILLAILIIFITQQPSVWTVVLALSVTGWASYARLVRGQVLALREREFLLAARVLGASTPRILLVHVIPNVMAPVVVQATFGVAGAILAEASLSFLGLGPQGSPSWGALLDQGAHYFLLTHHLATFPGLAIMVSVMGINFLGDGLRDWLDPHRLEIP